MKALEQSVEEARAVELFRALANPVRYRIVQSLAARGECIVGDLVLELPVAQSTVSEHLKVLREAGIVQGTVDGPNRCYCLDPRAFEILRTSIEAIEGQGGQEITVTNHPLCIAPGNPAVAARSKKLDYDDHGMHWQFSARNGFYSPFQYAA